MAVQKMFKTACMTGKYFIDNKTLYIWKKRNIYRDKRFFLSSVCVTLEFQCSGTVKRNIWYRNRGGGGGGSFGVLFES